MRNERKKLMLIVFGQNGQVAREIQIAAALRGLACRMISSSEADFRLPEQVKAILSTVPHGSVVINAAAYTAVDQAETDYQNAVQINARTPGLIARVCRERDCRLIHISTDYVFSGDKQGAYVEDDLTNPVNAYGQSKLMGEHEILQNLEQAIILRTSWVFSAHGKNFVKTMIRLGAERNRLSIVADQMGGPTSAQAIALACLQLANRVQDIPRSSSLWGIYHFSGKPATTWHGFAREIFRQSNLSVEVTAIRTNQFPTPARRPANSILNCQKLERDLGVRQPDWITDLGTVLHQLGGSIATSDSRQPAALIESA